MENWNSANKDLFYGKAGDLTGDDREHVEVSALALHPTQAAIAYLNTKMIQIVLRDPKWRKKLMDMGRPRPCSDRSGPPWLCPASRCRACAMGMRAGRRRAW